MDWAALSAEELEHLRVTYDTARMQDEACIAQLQRALQRHTLQLQAVQNELMFRDVLAMRERVQERIHGQAQMFRLTRIADLLAYYLARRYVTVFIDVPAFEKCRVRLTYQCFAGTTPAGPEITVWIDAHGALKNPLTNTYISLLRDHPRDWKL